MSLARALSKIEGWKYTSLHSAEQTQWNNNAAEQNNEPLETPKFTNEGDHLIAQNIVQHCDDVTQYLLGSKQSTTRDLALEIKPAKGNAFYKVIHVTVEADHKVTLTELFKTTQNFVNYLVIIELKENAQLSHYRMIDDATQQSTILAPVFVQAQKGATYTQIVTGRGAKTARFTTQGELLGASSHIDLRGVHKLNDDAHMDQTIVMRHMAPDCTSNQSIRYIVDGEANGTFQGQIHVDQIAQKTAAFQLCKSLLLSDRGRVNTKPELEIYADDVKCSHGATSGALDQNMMFYLQSRGIPEEKARSLLMEAFLKDVFDGIYVPPAVQEFVT